MKIPALLVINKIDTVPKEVILEVITEYEKAHDFEDYIPISAKLSDGIEILLVH